jgi:HSP20 family protein
LKVSADGYLSISGEKKNESEENTKDNYFSEISYGMFRRTIQLPWDLDYEATTARYNNGVLTVSIPKSQTEKQKFKKISVAKS